MPPARRKLRAVDRLLDHARPNRPRRLEPRERLVEAVAAGTFVLAAAMLAAASSFATPDAALVAGFVVAYAVADRIRLYHGAGFGAPTQLVLVPMLYELPPALVPAIVAAALVGNVLIDMALRRSRAERLLTSCADSWFAIGPAAIYAVADPGAPEFAQAGLLATAFAAECVLDFVTSTLREWAGRDVRPRLQVSVLAEIYTMDALLTAVGLLVSVAAATDRYAYLAALPLLGLLGVMARDRTARIDYAMDRLDALSDERARLRAAIRRTGRTFGVTLDSESLVSVLLETALDALEAQGAAVQLGASPVVTRGVATPELIAAASGRARTAGATTHVITSQLGGQNTLAVARPDPEFDDEERELLGYLAAQAGVSLENIALHELAQERARVDELTGLANHRAFIETVDTEINRARRHGTSVALLLLDIDDFKAINDGHGHLRGDLVLREIGRLMREHRRAGDLAARYGGEELALVLPETPLAGAIELAEGLRRAIAALDVRSLEGRPIQVTTSVGVAAFPECAPGREALFETADRALYRAKHTGKNRVVAADSATRRSA
jgi:diguanylate cyclase (GGDEF)-like protein